MSEEGENKRTKEYQEKYKPTLQQLSQFISDLVTDHDPEGLIFLYESISALVMRAGTLLDLNLQPKEPLRTIH